MANSVEAEAEYESEPEESVLLRRRTKASDDDNEVEEEENKMPVSLLVNRCIRRIGYADESDGRDGAPEYYGNDDDEVSYVDELEKLGEQVDEEGEGEVAEKVTAMKQKGKEKVNNGDNDAFAVPRTGAFYMHDDRFSVLGRRSRDHCRKKYIWEPKNELKWMHDKFEEITMEETHNRVLNSFELQRTSNGYHQVRDENDTKSGGYTAKVSRVHSKSANNGGSSKIVKGRGPVRYKPLSRSVSVKPPMKSMQMENTQGSIFKTDSANNKQQIRYKKCMQKTANADSERALLAKEKQQVKTPAKPFETTGDTDSSTVFSRKSKQSWDLGMAPYTDSASVSFHGINTDCHSLPLDQRLLSPSLRSYQQEIYPATSFHHDNLVKQKRMVLPGSRNAVFPASLPPNEIIHVPQANKFLQGNISLDISYAKEVSESGCGNYFTKLSFKYPVTGSTYMASPESGDLRIGSSLSEPFTYQATPFANKLNRVSSSQAQPNVQQIPVDSTIQPPSEVFSQQFHSHLQNGSQNLLDGSPLSFREPGTFESLAGSIKLKSASLGIGSNITTSPQSTGIQSDQKFNANPMLFPVMQFGGLHHGSFGVPAIDMSSTGYSGESEVHLRNTNLTWLPILPAAAGAVGATYHHPHVAPDGSCYGNLTTTPSIDIASYATHTSVPSNEASTSGLSNDSLPTLETDYVKKTAEQMKNKCGIQQFKAKRYSRMNMKE